MRGVDGSRASDEWVVVTAAEQRRIDSLAAAKGVSNDDLVESAGHSAAEWILEHEPARKIVALAGPGGNGADALVAARQLRASGLDVEAFLLSSGATAPSVERALQLYAADGGDAVSLGRGTLEPLRVAISGADLVIDGLYGSRLSRSLDGTAAAIVDLVNGAARRVVSLDVPSGVAADEGAVPGPAVSATVTLAMAFLKPAHLFFPAAGACGRVDVVDVAYPDDVRAAASPEGYVLQRSGAAKRLPARPPSGHKGTFGHVLLVAGSRGMMGAAILAGRGALRSGAGLLTMAVPASQAAIVHGALPEALVVPLGEEAGHLTPAALSDLRPALDRATVLAIGPGLSRADAATAAVASMLSAYSGPAVVDADALLALSRDRRCLDSLSGRAVLTPHPGEFAMLAGVGTPEADRDRVTAALRYARRHGVVLVLKGRPTVIGRPDGRVYLNPTGNSGLATGGSGDVLTGLLAGLVAGGASLDAAALVGPYVHGLAADLFAAAGSERSLIPSDVIELLPRAFREVESCV